MKNSWELVKFSDVVEFPPKVQLKKNEEYDLIEMEDIDIQKRYVHASKTKKYDSSGVSKFEDGDIIFARITPCLENGKIAQVRLKNKRKGFGSTEFFVFRPKKGLIDSDFLYYLSKSDIIKLSAINSMTGASGRQRADKTFVQNIELKLPEIKLQKKIATILTNYDELIENNNKRMELLERTAQEIYNEWFIRMRFPGHDSSEFNKEMPTFGRKVELGKICEEVRRNSKIENIDPKSIYVGLEHISRKSFTLKEYSSVSEVSSDKLKFNEKEILFSKIRPYLHKVALAMFSGYCSSDTIVLKPKEDKYLYFVLMTVFDEDFIEYANITSKGTKMPRADWKVLEKRLVCVPDDATIDNFNLIVKNIFECINKYRLANENMAKMRDLLLPRLMSGKLSIE
jgi:type I restriction enzyme, S subunit